MNPNVSVPKPETLNRAPMIIIIIATIFTLFIAIVVIVVIIAILPKYAPRLCPKLPDPRTIISAAAKAGNLSMAEHWYEALV